MKKIIIFAVFVMLFSSNAFAQCSEVTKEIFANESCSKIETYFSESRSQSPSLVVVLHGDAHLFAPAAHYRVARFLAKNQDNLVAVGLLRPGYKDDFGRISDGSRGNTSGDNYNDEQVEQIAQSIEKLKTHHNASNVILIGYYGGGTIAGRLIALYPDLVDKTAIISCSCEINQWRKNIYSLTEAEEFKGDLNILSPIELASKVSDKTKITLIVGSKDRLTPLTLTQTYYDALKQNNKQVDLHVIEGNHYIFQHPKVLSTLLNITDK